VIQLVDFQKCELRVAEVVAAEPIPGTDKLLQLTLDLGDEQRTTVAGIALCYSPAELIGRQVIVLANLEPVTLRGVRSEGMVLAAGDEKTVSLLAPDRLMPKGTRVR
jgi:methionine--tRNA ligase beta chain